GAEVDEISRRYRPQNRNAILNVGDNLRVSTWKNRSVVRKTGERAASAGPYAGRANGLNDVPGIVAIAHLAGGGIESHRADRPDIKAAKVFFAAHIIARERRGHEAAKPGDRGSHEVGGDHVRLFRF